MDELTMMDREACALYYGAQAYEQMTKLQSIRKRNKRLADDIEGGLNNNDTMVDQPEYRSDSEWL